MAPAELSLSSASPRGGRSHSVSSDRPSLSGYGGLLSPPLAVTPEPAFIAASAASQIVTNDHDSKSDSWFDQHGIEPSGETALVSQPALRLVNRFLDHLLFNFLSISKSTSLASLRPAVGEVLKPKLAKEAVSGADQELREYLGGGEDEELVAFHNVLEPSGDWDLELVWKRTRLRCMVYSSLGDMEEEDEDLYTERDQLDGPPGSNNRFAGNSGVVSPAVAIFLTSILEFMGEQILVGAGQAAYKRLRSKLEKEEREGTGTTTEEDIADRVVVEDADMEKVALDRTLGRLWRGWKKRIRSPTTSVSMALPCSPESLSSQARASRNGSIASDENNGGPPVGPLTAKSIHEHAASIPLPIADDDVREIEIPGLAKEINDGDAEAEKNEEVSQGLKRPKSMLLLLTSHLGEELVSPTSSQSQTLFLPASRKRSHSQPSAARLPYTSPLSKRSKIASVEANDDQEMTGMAAEDAEKNVTTAATEDVAPGEDVGEQIETKPVWDITSEEVHSEQAESSKSVVGDQVPGEEDTAKTRETTNEVAGKQVGGNSAEPSSEESREETEDSSKGLVAGILAGAAAFGAAAVAGIAAAATGQAPQTDLGNKDETDEEEEPEVMTSSRISLGGRVSLDDARGLQRKVSGRASSIRSVRLVDVPSPSRSRHGSVDATDYVGGRPTFGSRPGSVHSSLETPRVASPVSRSVTSSPLTRPGSQLSARHVRSNTSESITEEREASMAESSPLTAIPADIATAMQGVDMMDTPTNEQLVSRSVSRETTPQPAKFVLSAPPGPRNGRDANRGFGQTESTAPQQSSSNLGVVSRTPGTEHGVPPLTPLREMMERAEDTSDEASSIAPSNDAQSVSDYGHSPSASASSLPNNVVREAPRTARPSAASVTRNSPPRDSKKHNAGSASGSSSSSQKLRPVRTAEEEVPRSPSHQDFEQLIRSDQTIQYTLTPQNMRNIEGAPDSPLAPRFTATSVAVTQQEARPATSRSASSSIGKYTGLHSNPPTETPKAVKSGKLLKPASPVPVELSKPTKSGKVPRSGPPPTANTGARLRPNAPQPRDARIERESMGDLAEFIASTAPPGSYDYPARSTSSANGNDRTVSRSSSRIGTAASLPRRTESSSGRNKLQARDAVVPRGDSISDLIDFVRSGPQLEKENHRIPRTVAPFRTTMDSDQMSGAAGGKAIDASLPDPRYSQASVSMNGSINSQSALLANNSKSNRPLPGQRPNNFDDEVMIPKRKTRKVRDMYQIDLSDEEDEYDTYAHSKPKPIKEESLAEFLANVPPPADSSPAPLYNAAALRENKISKKTSSPSLMSRFGRKDSFTQLPPKPKSSGQDSRSSRTSSRAPQLPQHTPIAVQFTSNKPATYEPARGTGTDYVSQLDTARNKVAQKSYQPRETVYTGHGTSDLANFLRSEPPTSVSSRPQTFKPTSQKEESNAFQRLFGRKKNAAH